MSKFSKLLPIYNDIRVNNDNRQECYNLASEIYFDLHGEHPYSCYEIFAARLNMHLNKETPMEATVNRRKK
jgi:hypothetical protein